MRTELFRYLLIPALAAGLSTGAVAQTATEETPAAETEEAPATPPVPVEEAAPDEPLVETETEAETPAEEPTTEPAPEETDTSTETPSEVTNTPAPAQPEQAAIVTEEFGDWELRCTADKSNCFLYQLARDPQNNPVAEFTMIALPSGGDAEAGATVVTPLGTLLTSGLTIRVDSGQARQYPFNWCTRSGCFARFGLSSADITAMKRGNAATMAVASVSSPEQPVTVSVSLTGFTAGFTALQEAGAPQQQ